MRYNRKTARERKGGILAFRVNQDERKALDFLCELDGISITKYFRSGFESVLQGHTMKPVGLYSLASEIPDFAKRAAAVQAKQEEIRSRTDLSEAVRENQASALFIQFVLDMKVEYEARMKRKAKQAKRSA